MTRILTLFVILLFRNISFGQTDVEKEIIQKLDIGYSTRWDVQQLVGKGELLDDYFLDPHSEYIRGKYDWYHANGIQYKDKGIAFICANDGERISSIHLNAPFTLALPKRNVICLGETCLADIFPEIDTIKVSTTGGSNYWSFRIDKYYFYVAKSVEHRNKKYHIELQNFIDSLEYYKNQPISIVTISLHLNGSFEEDYTKAQDDLYGTRPLYAPKEITHLNCYDLGWPEDIHTLMLPLYILTGGQKSQEFKQGHWEEYGANHQLIYEGAYRENIKIGVFKYYDKEGNLERTKKYSKLNFYLNYVVCNRFRLRYFKDYLKK